jgi:hypothetical protein
MSSPLSCEGLSSTRTTAESSAVVLHNSLGTNKPVQKDDESCSLSSYRIEAELAVDLVLDQSLDQLLCITWDSKVFETFRPPYDWLDSTHNQTHFGLIGQPTTNAGSWNH